MGNNSIPIIIIDRLNEETMSHSSSLVDDGVILPHETREVSTCTCTCESSIGAYTLCIHIYDLLSENQPYCTYFRTIKRLLGSHFKQDVDQTVCDGIDVASWLSSLVNFRCNMVA